MQKRVEDERLKTIDKLVPKNHLLRKVDVDKAIDFKQFYDEYYNCVICPNNQVLKYTTTNRDGYREFKSNPHICKSCPYLSQCTNSNTHQKLVTKHKFSTMNLKKLALWNWKSIHNACSFIIFSHYYLLFRHTETNKIISYWSIIILLIC